MWGFDVKGVGNRNVLVVAIIRGLMRPFLTDE